ncbi:transporter [Bacillus sp. FJAT-42376]|uniref:transporter n=1 Tax=Bacillus sp. FJAT-42376 TaxID=2014076 RepID=UPI001F1539E9|nr:transporter [Bacillus sp. FJAT-42376]
MLQPPPPPPGGGFPGGGGGQQGPSQQPPGPPPSFTPQQQQATAFAVDPGGIRRCLFRNTYVWLINGQQFWFYPTFVGRNSVAGFRWFPQFRQWGYFGIDLRQISSFTCF